MKMSKPNLFIVLSMISVFFCLSAYVVIYYYPYVFSKTVTGKIFNIEIAKDIPTNPYVIALRSDTSEIYTASSSDRQWSVVRQGQCAEARFFPAPPWRIEKAGTYIDVRLLKLWDCQDGQKLTYPTTSPEGKMMPSPPGSTGAVAPSITPSMAPSATPIPGVGGINQE